MNDKYTRFLTLASVVLVVAVLYVAQEVLVPIALAMLFSFLLAPLVNRLEKIRLPRILAVLISVCLALGIVGAIGFTVYNEVSDLAQNMPRYRSNIQAKIDSVRSGSGFFKDMKNAREEVQHMLSAPATAPSNNGEEAKPPVPVVLTGSRDGNGNSLASPMQLIEDLARNILSPVGLVFVVVVFTIFMLLEREELRDRLISLVGRSRLTVTTEALDDAASRVSRYLLMQLIVNGSVGVIVMIALWTIGKANGQPFPSPALWGLLAGTLRFIPYVGIWIAAAMPFLLSLAVFSSAKVALEVFIAYMTIEVIAANALEPMLFGSSTGIATLAVLVAALFWTWLWGGYGLLLATPLTVCLVVIGKHVPQLGFLTILLGDAPPLEPCDRVYQRLLALDEEAAANLVHEYARKMSIEDLYDTVLLPVLVNANIDLQRGNIDDNRATAIHRGMREIIEESAERFGKAENLKPEDKAPAPISASPRLPQGCNVNVVCVGAHDEADEIVGLMLARLLQIRGYCAAVVSSEKLTSERVSAVDNLTPDLVCISSLPPGATIHARYLYKRLAEKLPELGVLVGVWTARGDLNQVKERIGKVEIAADLRGALGSAHEMAQAKVLAGGEPR